MNLRTSLHTERARARRRVSLHTEKARARLSPLRSPRTSLHMEKARARVPTPCVRPTRTVRIWLDQTVAQITTASFSIVVIFRQRSIPCVRPTRIVSIWLDQTVAQITTVSFLIVVIILHTEKEKARLSPLRSPRTSLHLEMARARAGRRVSLHTKKARAKVHRRASLHTEKARARARGSPLRSPRMVSTNLVSNITKIHMLFTLFVVDS
jgi:hypothetical protein